MSSAPVRARYCSAPAPMRNSSSEHGAALIVTLLMLIAVLMLGASAFQISWQGEKAARGDRDRQLAFHAAEAALADARADIELSSRRHFFANAEKEDGSGRCDDVHDDSCVGVYEIAEPSQQAPWLDDEVWSEEQILSVSYGHFTGRIYPAGAGTMSVRLPRYIIERITEIEDGNPSGKPLYRITSLGFGMRDSSQVMLQAYYRPRADSELSSGFFERLSGWREIPDWMEVRNTYGSE